MRLPHALRRTMSTDLRAGGHRRVRLLAAGLALATGGTLLAPVSSATASPLPPIQKGYFGMHAYGVTQDDFPDATVGAVRLWDVGTTWADVQPVARRWREADFAKLDAAVKTTLKKRAQPMIVLGQTPAWASSQPRAGAVYGPGTSAMPRSLTYWRSYVAKIVQRYKGKVSVYQIWNEPNVSTFFTGTPAQMAVLTNEAAAVIRRYDRRAYIVGPGFATRRPTNLPWMKQFYAAGGGKSLNAVALHLYPGPTGSPESTLTQLAAARTILKAAKISKPIWNTEVNYGAAYGGGRPRRIAGTSAAGYTARTYLLNAANGVARVYWYAWAGHGITGIDMTKADGITPTPAGVALTQTARWMVGARVERCSRDRANTWTCSLTYGRRSFGRAVWNPTRAVGYRAWAGATKVESLDGTTRRIRPGQRVAITNAPVLIRSTVA